MVRRRLTLADRVTTVPVDHLIHRPFLYVFRIENQRPTPTAVTVRVFIVPTIAVESAAGDDRRAWIEMDKFVVRLTSSEKNTVVRRGNQSSVIRKPAEMMPPLLKELGVTFDAAQLEAMRLAGLAAAIVERLQPRAGQPVGVSVLARLLGDADWRIAQPFLGRFATVLPSEQPMRPSQNDTADMIEQQEVFNYCSCGWPFNLLLPRSTPAGMPFRIAVICSDWQVDQVAGEESCGSLSFCGARDRYPDRRPMGYPFNARFADSSINVFMANANIGVRDFVIRRMPDVDSDD